MSHGRDVYGPVQNGVVVFERGLQPPEGTRVRVETVGETDEATPTLAERLSAVIGVARGLPTDLAEHHDHYVHGTPKP